MMAQKAGQLANGAMCSRRHGRAASSDACGRLRNQRETKWLRAAIQPPARSWHFLSGQGMGDEW